MLPWDLAVYRIRKGRIYAGFRDLSGQNWDTAQRVIDTFIAHKGRTKWELEEKLEELTITPAYKFVKGLIKIMERRCIYEDGSDAIDFRCKVFKRFPEDPEIRAKELNMPKEEMLRRMFADINPKLLNVIELSAVELLKRYNLSLAQTLLFKAISIKIHFSNPAVYRAIKYFGLIYRMDSKGSVIVDGPASLFSSTTRYGTRFAKILPYIISKPPWSVKAYLKIKGEELLFELNHIRHGYYFPLDVREELEEENPFRLKTCTVEKFGNPIKTGPYYTIPDYKIVCGERVAYVEIFKFWTRGYIEERAKYALKENIPLLFLLKQDGNISNDAPPELDNVMIFRTRVLEDVILRYLKSIWLKSFMPTEKEKRVEKEEQKSVLEDLARKLETVEKYEDAERIITEMGLPVMETLHTLGYNVIWKGLIPYKIKKVK